MFFLKSLIIALIFLLAFAAFAQEEKVNCDLSEDLLQQILEEVTKKNSTVIKNLPDCFKLNRKLIFKTAIIDAEQFQYAAKNLQDDEVFVRRLLKINPAILQFASPRLRNDQDFMQRATYLHRDALKYADSKLLDNKIFMKKMITIDSRNYIFASDRLKEIEEFAEIAFSDNGLLLEFAPKTLRSNFKFVKIALKSNSSAIDFVADELKNNKELQQLAINKNSLKFQEQNKKNLEEFLQKNYVIEEKKKNLGLVIANKSKFFAKNKIIEREYVTKWQKNLNYGNKEIGENLRLINVESRNYENLWKEDFKKYPALIKKIENFLLKHNLDQSTIDSLSTTFLWKIKSQPLTFAFNLYLLRDSDDIDLGPEFSNITSLTAIVQQQKNRYQMTVVEVIFDSEIKVDVGYANGHKKYVLWDLYQLDKNDKNPKIIFKIEDRFKDYFEVFEEQNNGKYQMVLQKGITTNPLP